MGQPLLVALSIALVVVLVAVFVVSFILYVKTPAPKGCENLGRDESKCSTCPETACRFYSIHHEDDKGETKKGD